jgi:hypothetical protein
MDIAEHGQVRGIGGILPANYRYRLLNITSSACATAEANST